MKTVNPLIQKAKQIPNKIMKPFSENLTMLLLKFIGKQTNKQKYVKSSQGSLTYYIQGTKGKVLFTDILLKAIKVRWQCKNIFKVLGLGICYTKIESAMKILFKTEWKLKWFQVNERW